MRHQLLLPLTLLVAATHTAPAWAAGVGMTLPKFRTLSITGPSAAAPAATSYGGSVQVIGGNFGLRPLQIGLALDYVFTRDFAQGGNYSFFDPSLQVGVPLGLSSQFYVTPAVEARYLWMVTSPQGLDSALGFGPSLTVGYRPSTNVSVELTLAYTRLPALVAQGGQLEGNMGTVEIGGSYSF